MPDLRAHRLMCRYWRIYERAILRLYNGQITGELVGAKINWEAGLHDDATFTASLDDIEREMRADA